MKKYRYIYPIDSVSMPGLPENSLFLDIETTGFDRTSTYLTIIGLAWQEKEQIIIEQWFNETGHIKEPVLLLELEHFIAGGKQLPKLIHYNGNTFDLPYLKAKYEQYHLPTSLSECESFDLYQLAKKYRFLLSLTGLKQKNLEEAFGLYREDQLSGQELIEYYLRGIRQGDDNLINAYLLHNKEDMEGMVFLQNLDCFDRFLNGNFEIERWEESSSCESISVLLTGNMYLPKPLFVSSNGIDYRIASGQIDIKLPVRQMEARYFYDNYKDYYYLPAEDCAIHKSVASFVEKEYRKKATRETCYTKKTASYLPLPLPSSCRKKKECLKECGKLQLFYRFYGDDTAWILKDCNEDSLKKIYLKNLLSTII